MGGQGTGCRVQGTGYGVQVARGSTGLTTNGFQRGSLYWLSIRRSSGALWLSWCCVG